MAQISMFDGSQAFKIDKPIRLIELFAGIGSQAKALQRLGVDFESWYVCEFDKYAMASYNAIHGTNYPTSDVTKITAKDLNIINTNEYIYIYLHTLSLAKIYLLQVNKKVCRKVVAQGRGYCGKWNVYLTSARNYRKCY